MSTTDNKKNVISKAFSPINNIDRQTMSDTSNSAKSRKKRRLVKRLILPIGFVVLLTAAGTLAGNLLGIGNNDSGSGSASNQIQSVFSGEELQDYASAENGFTILMPGIPEISSSSIKSGDKDIPVTTYQRAIDNNTKNYTLSVYDYSGIAFDENETMQNIFNQTTQDTPKAELISNKAGKYGKLNAVEGHYKLTEDNADYETHIRLVVKGSKVYVMKLIGADQAKFNEFANSLRFN